jgi:hypothetical protein
MATPNFRLLLNAMRLGQPQDPQAAIRALAEEVAAQEEVVEDLRKRLHVATSAYNLLEAKSSRIERELEVLRARTSDAVERADELAAVYERPGTERPSPTFERPSPNFERSASPTFERAPAPTFERPAPTFSNAFEEEPSAAPISESGDDFNLDTMVVSRKDLEALRTPEAPFKIAPAGQRPPAPPRSIPGSPWQRSRSNAPPPNTPPPPMAEAAPPPSHRPPPQQPRHDEDGETYPDTGGLPSLAAALGLSPNDPRIQALRPSAPPRPQTDPPQSNRPPRR